MIDWAAWGDDSLDWDRDDREATRKQVICDDCGKASLRGLIYRSDFEQPKRLCRECCDRHDKHPQVIAEREFHEAMESDHDDF
ncbi:hypothetical protein AB3480_00685 [Rhizobium mongolense]|uniref:hypothetical protein n=1 Tax=Rhizobium mongolense TaxID=57676 RepID=UPI0034A168AC